MVWGGTPQCDGEATVTRVSRRQAVDGECVSGLLTSSWPEVRSLGRKSPAVPRPTSSSWSSSSVFQPAEKEGSVGGACKVDLYSCHNTIQVRNILISKNEKKSNNSELFLKIKDEN